MINYIDSESPEYEFLINTGSIYTQITSKWRNYPRELFRKLEEDLEFILTNAKIVTAPWDGNKEYFEKKIEKKDFREEKAEKNLDYPPYFQYYVKYENEGYSLTAFNHSFILLKSSYPDHFNFFFALTLVITDEMKILKFLEFHLFNSFESDLPAYKDFMFSLITKYPELLKNGKIDALTTQFFENMVLNTKKSIQNDTLGTKRVLALYYLFDVIALPPKRGLAKAKFVSMVTGLNFDYVKKIMEKPLERKKTLKGQKEDFEFLIEYFNHLRLESVVQKLEKELNYIANNKNK